MDRHDNAVATITKAVKGFHERKEAFRIYHGSTNSTRTTSFDSKKIIDTSNLSHVLFIDKGQKYAIVEPNVPMDKLVQATLKYGLIPPVVPEFPGITVGGSFSGTAGESSSFKYGFFNRTVNWCDMILANGETIKASPSENADLFHGAAGAFGTLGVTTLFSIQLIPSTNSAEGLTTIKSLLQVPHYDYLNGILFSPTHGVIITGHLTNITPHKKITRFTRAHDPWFYLHAQQGTSSSSSSSSPCPPSTVPIYDYLFRYDRGAFWMGQYSFHHPFTPFNRLTRFILNPLLRTRKLYQLLHASGHAQRFIIQDLAIPAQNATPFLTYLASDFPNIYPLWLCPLQALSETPMHFFPPNTPFVLNVGLWGPPCEQAQRGKGPNAYRVFVEENRALEKKVTEMEGWKWLYAQTFYPSEDAFWASYGGSGWYDVLRKKYHAEGLPTIFDKVKSAGVRVGVGEGVVSGNRDAESGEDNGMPTIAGEWKGLRDVLMGRNTLLKR